MRSGSRVWSVLLLVIQDRRARFGVRRFLVRSEVILNSTPVLLARAGSRTQSAIDRCGLGYAPARFPVVKSAHSAIRCGSSDDISSQCESRRSLQFICSQVGGSRGIARQPLKLLGREAAPVSGIPPRSNNIQIGHEGESWRVLCNIGINFHRDSFRTS